MKPSSSCNLERPLLIIENTTVVPYVKSVLRDRSFLSSSAWIATNGGTRAVLDFAREVVWEYA